MISLNLPVDMFFIPAVFSPVQTLLRITGTHSERSKEGKRELLRLFMIAAIATALVMHEPASSAG